MVFVQPETERRTEQRRKRPPTSHQSHHAQAEPDAIFGVPSCLELARRFCADQPGEGRPLFTAFLVESSFMLKAREATQESRLQLRHNSRTLWSCSSRVKNSRSTEARQLAEVGSAQRPAHGNEYVLAGLDQYPLVHGQVDLALRFDFVGQNFPARVPLHNRVACGKSPNEPSRVSATMRGDAGLLGEDLEGQENLKVHEFRGHVRPSVEVSPRVLPFPSPRQSPRSYRARSPGSP